MMSTRDVSFVWPLTSLGFIFTTLAAHFLLHEKVSATRWIGVLLIAIGAGLTGYSEAAKDAATQPPDTTQRRSAPSKSSSTAPSLRAASMVWCWN